MNISNAITRLTTFKYQTRLSSSRPFRPLNIKQIPTSYEHVFKKMNTFVDANWQLPLAKPVFFRDLVRENFQSSDVDLVNQRKELRFTGFDLNPLGGTHIEMGSLYPLPKMQIQTNGIQRLYQRLQYTRDTFNEFISRFKISPFMIQHHVRSFGELSLITPQPNGTPENQLIFIEEFLNMYNQAKNCGVSLMPALLGNACPDYCKKNLKRDFNTDVDYIHRAVRRLREFDPNMKIILYISGAFGVFKDKKNLNGIQFYVNNTKKIVDLTKPDILSLGDTFGLGTHDDINLMMQGLNQLNPAMRICLHSHGYDENSLTENIQRIAQNNAVFLKNGGDMFDGNSIPLSTKNFVVSGEQSNTLGWSGNLPLSLLLCQSILQGFSVNGAATVEEKAMMMARVYDYLANFKQFDRVFEEINPTILKSVIPKSKI